MTRTTLGERRTLVTLQTPGPGVPDGDGGTTSSWTNLTPATAFAKIVAATGKDSERLAAGTVLTTQTRLVTIPFHAGVTTKTRLTWTDVRGLAHLANVVSAQPDERRIDMELVCVEVPA